MCPRNMADEQGAMAKKVATSEKTRLQRFGAWLKKGPIALGNYIRIAYGDYKEVGVGTLTNFKKRPVRGCIYLMSVGAVGYLFWNNPSEYAFRNSLHENMNKVMMVEAGVRNPNTVKHLEMLSKASNRGELKRYSFGVGSLIFKNNYGSGLDIYHARCPQLKPTYKDYISRIEDVGINGHWLMMERNMIDYDINPNEWPAEEEVSMLTQIKNYTLHYFTS